MIILTKLKEEIASVLPGWLNNGTYAPPEVCTIILTDKCFFKCKMCDFWKNSKSDNADIYPNLSDWKRFILKLKAFAYGRLEGDLDGRFTIVISGGEPLSHQYIYDIIGYASSLGFRTVIPSNGFLINKTTAEKLRKAGLSKINLSLDSIEEKIHDKVRGFKGAYKGVMRAIDILSKSRYPEIGISSVIQEDTYRGIPELVEYVQNNKHLKIVLLNAVMQPFASNFETEWYKSTSHPGIWPKDIIKVTEIIDRLACLKKQYAKDEKERGIKDKFLTSLSQLDAFKIYFNNPSRFIKTNSACHFGTNLMVNANGDLYMCHYYNKIGNIKSNDFGMAWKSGKARVIREKISKCKTNCHNILNCYFKDDYPFGVSDGAMKSLN